MIFGQFTFPVSGGQMIHPRIVAAAAIGTLIWGGSATLAPESGERAASTARASGTYAILAGADTAVIERWNRTDSELDVTMDVIGQARLEFRAGLSADASDPSCGRVPSPRHFGR